MENSFNNNFISSINDEKERVMHSKNDDIEILINDESNEAIKELFGSLKKRYQNNLESMKGSEFVFDYVQLSYYKTSKRGGLYIDFPGWIKKSKDKPHQ